MQKQFRMMMIFLSMGLASFSHAAEESSPRPLTLLEQAMQDFSNHVKEVCRQKGVDSPEKMCALFLASSAVCFQAMCIAHEHCGPAVSPWNPNFNAYKHELEANGAINRACKAAGHDAWRVVVCTVRRRTVGTVVNDLNPSRERAFTAALYACHDTVGYAYDVALRFMTRTPNPFANQLSLTGLHQDHFDNLSPEGQLYVSWRDVFDPIDFRPILTWIMAHNDDPTSLLAMLPNEVFRFQILALLLFPLARFHHY